MIAQGLRKLGSHPTSLIATLATAVAFVGGLQVFTPDPAAAVKTETCMDVLGYTVCFEDSAAGDQGGTDSGNGGGDVVTYPPFDTNDPNNCCDESRPDYEDNWQNEVDGSSSDEDSSDDSSGRPGNWGDNPRPGYSGDPNCDATGCPINYRGYGDDPTTEWNDRARYCRLGLSPECDSFCIGSNAATCSQNRQNELDRQTDHQIDRDIQDWEEKQEHQQYCGAHPRDPSCRTTRGRTSRKVQKRRHSSRAGHKAHR